jgi:hypothetical protein
MEGLLNISILSSEEEDQEEGIPETLSYSKSLV